MAAGCVGENGYSDTVVEVRGQEMIRVLKTVGVGKQLGR
jgi:hypothetical protein